MKDWGKLAVIDLDGTLCRRNTLHLYLLTALKYHLSKRNFGKVCAIAGKYLLRGLHLLSHAEFKFGALEIAGDDDELTKRFSNAALRAFNQDVVRLIKKLEDSRHRIVLATAAPLSYVRHIWKGEAIATVWPGQAIPVECRGEEKLRRVREYAGEPEVVVTDHYDDLPLLKAATRRYLVNPSAKTVRKALAAGIPCDIIGN